MQQADAQQSMTHANRLTADASQHRVELACESLDKTACSRHQQGDLHEVAAAEAIATGH